MFKRIKYYFQMKLWTVEMVKMAVKKGVVTKEQFEEITGEEYQ